MSFSPLIFPILSLLVLLVLLFLLVFYNGYIRLTWYIWLTWFPFNHLNSLSSNTLRMDNLMIDITEIHNEISKFAKLCSDHWFRYVVGYHIVRWTVLDCDLISVYQICHIEHFDIKVPCASPSTCSCILCELHTTRVLLIHNIQLHLEVLPLNEPLSPEYFADLAVDSM